LANSFFVFTRTGIYTSVMNQFLTIKLPLPLGEGWGEGNR